MALFTSHLVNMFTSDLAEMFTSDLANMFTSASANMFTIDLANMFTSHLVNIFTSDWANMFTSDLTNMFTSELEKCKKMIWPTCSLVKLTGEYVLALYQEYNTWSKKISSCDFAVLSLKTLVVYIKPTFARRETPKNMPT